MFKSLLWLALALATVTAFFLYKNFMLSSALEQERSSFTFALNTYIDTPYAWAENNLPYIRRKVIIIDTEKRDVDSKAYTKLSEDIRARGPYDVGTIVLVTWGEEKEGAEKESAYKDTVMIPNVSYRGKAHVHIIDWVDKIILQEKDFLGEISTGGLNSTVDSTNHWPVPKIIDYLERLPRKM